MLNWFPRSPHWELPDYSDLRSQTPKMLIAQLLHATRPDTYYQVAKLDVLDITPADKSTRERRHNGIVGLRFAPVHRNPQVCPSFRRWIRSFLYPDTWKPIDWLLYFFFWTRRHRN